MPAPVPVPVRLAMKARWEQGASASELAVAFGVPARTVRDLVRRWREQPERGVAPAYRRPARSPSDHPAYAPAVMMRREHPGWGAGLIRVYLKRDGGEPLPSERTLQRWFRSAGLGPAPPGRRSETSARRGEAPHDVRQVDAAEAIAMADGTAGSSTAARRPRS